MNNRDAVKIIAESIDSYLTEIEVGAKRLFSFEKGEDNGGSVKHSIEKLTSHAKFKMLDGYIGHCDSLCKFHLDQVGTPGNESSHWQNVDKALHYRDAAEHARKLKASIENAHCAKPHPSVDHNVELKVKLGVPLNQK